MKGKNFFTGILVLTLLLALSACAGSNQNSSSKGKTSDDEKTTTDHSNMNMDDMDMSGSGEVPKGLKTAENPTYKIGTHVIVKAAHMEGMDGTEATISGAFDTTAYAVTYTPTTGGPKVKNHKWVIHEEIENAGSVTLKPGTEVTLNADHMKGMMGAKGTIDSAEYNTVYMIDYTPTTGGPKVKNHQWVTESELSLKK